MAFVFCARIPAACTERSEVYFYHGDEPLRIASSFGDFLRQYVEHGIQALWPR